MSWSSGARTQRSGAHGSTEHHEHRYVADEKQEPTVTHGAVNEAMHAAEVKLLDGWSDIVSEWEATL